MLTDAYIKSLKIGDKKRHADLYGLVLELRPTKKKLNKVFIFRFQWEKKPQTMTLGNYPCLSLADARIKAISHRDLLNRGTGLTKNPFKMDNGSR
ncbi:Arm DNA-binding domain-containing protein [Legionella tucsonensis]|uniref:Integrase n=1 Tax=Legionella tucsonensis TaxID=40335 RepID=A0A0W0ZTC7_9GAMM|nr:Arm DNA-binding domain-containing protein [Legionella tucsonensis]KTD72444.1 integrase [Legionella tucsonensis]